jgi:hypothetical protein
MTEGHDQMTTEIAGYAAEYDSGHARMCFGYAETPEGAMAVGRAQFAGASRTMQLHMAERVYARPLTAEQASEVMEMLATPW